MDTASYHTFSEFFVRPLRSEVRLVGTNPNASIIPANDVINQLGKIEEDRILQAKGHSYSLEALLAGNCLMADLSRNDMFVTIYLPPHNYHRVYIPYSSTLREVIYVLGDLFSINRLTAQSIPNLFARNGRVICPFDTEFDPMAQILVGVTIVGSIETVQAGVIVPPHGGIIRHQAWPAGENDGSMALLKGQEMGRLKLGSTVTNLLALGKVNLIEQLEGLSVTRTGQPLVISAETFIVLDAEPALLPAEEIEAEHDASPLADDKKDQV